MHCSLNFLHWRNESRLQSCYSCFLSQLFRVAIPSFTFLFPCFFTKSPLGVYLAYFFEHFTSNLFLILSFLSQQTSLPYNVYSFFNNQPYYYNVAFLLQLKHPDSCFSYTTNQDKNFCSKKIVVIQMSIQVVTYTRLLEI